MRALYDDVCCLFFPAGRGNISVRELTSKVKCEAVAALLEFSLEVPGAVRPLREECTPGRCRANWHGLPSTHVVIKSPARLKKG